MGTTNTRFIPALVALLLLTASARQAAAGMPEVLESLRGNRVVLTLKDGRTLRGRLVQVGAEAVLLSRDSGPTRVIPFTQIAKARPVLDSEHKKWRNRPRRLVDADGKRLASALTTWRAGMGLTLGGMGVITLAGVVGIAASFCGFTGFNFSMSEDDYDSDTSSSDNCGKKIAGAWAVFGIGAAVLALGTATWVTGAVRRSLAYNDSNRERRRKGWLAAGIGVTLVGVALSGAGVALLTIPGADDSQVGGGFALGVGLYAALLVGVPMWIEAWRHRPGRRPTSAGAAPTANRQTLDPRHEQDRRSRLALGQPRATMFSTQLQF